MEMLEEKLVVVIGWDGREKLNVTSCVVLLNYQINDSLGRDVPRFLMKKGGGMEFLSLIRNGGTKKVDQGARG